MAKKSETITIHLNAFAEHVGKQIRAQGYKISSKDAATFEKSSFSITWLKMRSLISEGETDKLRKKLGKQIVAHVFKTNK